VQDDLAGDVRQADGAAPRYVDADITFLIDVDLLGVVD